ncbi:MAG: hypothetical protein M3680_27155 [Myxococcota bacterium]|nr:hypothetical protein [Myxococcota bacterium]
MRAELAGDRKQASALLTELVADPSDTFDIGERIALVRNLRALGDERGVGAQCEEIARPPVFSLRLRARSRNLSVKPGTAKLRTWSSPCLRSPPILRHAARHSSLAAHDESGLRSDLDREHRARDRRLLPHGGQLTAPLIHRPFVQRYEKLQQSP